MRPGLAVIAAVLCAALPSGCGAGAGGSSSTSAPSSSHGATVAVPAPPERLAMFRTPGGEVGCVIAAGSARCDVAKRAWKPPPKPPSCGLDWAQGAIVGETGRGRLTCAGDTTLDGTAPVLGYGRATRLEGFDCTSRARGVRCVHRVTGHGFFVSRRSYQLF